MTSAKCRNITLYPFDITKSETIANVLPLNCDFVFVDAQKSQYGNYLEKIHNNLSSENNIILLDDVVKYQTKLDTLYKFLEKNQINYNILPSEEGD
jgi:predicted O-methyltransferase YrrM